MSLIGTRRAIAIALATIAAVATTTVSAQPAPTPTPRPRSNFRTTVCMTYEDGGGLCGRAHWQEGPLTQYTNLETGATYTARIGTWVFDTITEQYCLRGAYCEDEAPSEWGDK